MPDKPTIHAVEVGATGRTVVFLHGLFGQGKNFTQAAKSLVPEFRSMLIDLPDHGQSAWTDGIDYADMADRVAGFLRDEVAPDGSIDLVGHSMGGKVAMVLALRHPDLVRRLVVVDISPSASEDSGEFQHLLDSLAELDLATLNRRGEADERLADQIEDPRVRGFLLQNLRSGPDGFMWQANLAVLRRDLAAIGDFPQLDGTFDGAVLWMAGDRSSYITDQDEPAMRRLFPRTTLVTVKGAGHWVHSEQPEAFASALRVFLSAD
ncbi:MAG: alpha/beta fold hydrolase [Aeromicrobium sp.]|uniref:alpha/beta fold hydrolase n=1 Tax=Aeromicrobium sp. TaxID=1871063 RepID=UPI003C670592